MTTPEPTPWEATQTQRSVDLLHNARGFDTLLRKIKALREVRQAAQEVVLRGPVQFMRLRVPDTNATVLVRHEPSRPAKELFRVGDDKASERVRIDFFSLSPSGRWIAVGTSDAGTEETNVQVLDARTGAARPDRSADVRNGELAWLPDDTGYLYMRGRGRKSVPLQDQIRDLSVALHLLSEPGKPDEVAEDIEVVGSRASEPSLRVDFEYCYPQVSPDGRDVVMVFRKGMNPDLRVVTKPRRALTNPGVAWRTLYDDGDHVTSYAVDTGRLVVVKSLSPTGAVIEEASLAGPGRKRVLRTSTSSVSDVIVVDGKTFVVENYLATKRLLAIAGDGTATEVPLPDGVSVVSSSIRPDRKSARLAVEVTSWVEPSAWFAVSARGRRVEPIVAAASAMQPLDGVEVATIEAPARDGEMVPVTVVSSKGAAASKHPYVWVTAYGAYGKVNSPVFTPTRRVFLESGGTLVVAHVRGGGEKGRAWHEQARGPTKVKTIEDLIDVVKHLRGAGYGASGGIFLYGGSAGGIPVAGLVVREPSLVDAAAVDGGGVNMTRLETSSAVGPLHAEEFGTSATPEAAQHLREIDAYLNVRDGVAYPPMLLRAGVNDARVPRWQSSKFVARLQQANTGSAPILFRLTGGGHIGGNTVDEEAASSAEILAFALRGVGHPDYR